jgi:hypothetical protein
MNSIGSINSFVDTMLESKAQFENIKASFEQKSDLLDDIINNFRQEIESILNVKILVEDEDMQRLYNGASDELVKMLKGVTNSIENIQKGMKFITDYEQSFNVVVFGKVKAGKSYLGNFIMGNVIRDLGISSSYDKFERPKVEVYDRGNVSTREKLSEISEEGNEGFRVDPNEATSAIQLFKLGGMTWFDTPGIGSVTWENEMLAKDYVDNADLIVYTSNSDAAGTRQDFTEMKALYEKGKTFLLLLTQSDAVEEDCDDDGEIVSVIVPKSDKDRMDTELYMCNTLRDIGIPSLSQGKEILTVSTKLALTALENHDEEMFQASNIGKLLDILKEITKNEGAALKRKTPGNRINATVNDIIDKLGQSNSKLEEYRRSLLDKKQSLSERSDELLVQMQHQCLTRINRIIRQKSNEVEGNGSAITGEALTQMLSEEICKVLRETCIDEFSESCDILSQYTEKLQLENVGELKMRTDEITYTLHKVVRVSRDPEGLWEHVCSFFGKQYYRSDVKDVEKKSMVKLGVNEQQIQTLAKDRLAELFESEVPDMMKKICDYIIKPIMEMHELAEEYIENAISGLEKIKC